MKKKLKTSPLLAKMLWAAEGKNSGSFQTGATPTSFSSRLNDIIKLHKSGQLAEAYKLYQKILNELNLDKLQKARVYSLLGTIHLQQNQFEDAEKLLSQALKLNPSDASAHNNLGVTYKQVNNKAASIIHFAKAVALDPNYPDALNNYGAALLDQRDIKKAISYLDRAIALKPDYADSYYNLGTAYQSLKLFDKADESFQKALSINPRFISALFNSGLLRLLRGEFEQGWRLYEYRWEDDQAKKFVRTFTQPLWLGDTDIKDKTIFLYAEQGLGDFIQFCRYTLIVEKLGAKVILLVPKELMSLAVSLSNNFTLLPRVGTETNIQCEFDYHCPILSLPLAFKTTLETIPAKVPYLFTPAEKTKIWQKKLGKKISPRIGLVWSGAAGHLNDANRSINLKLLAPNLPINVEYHVLQKEIRTDDLDTLNTLKLSHNVHTHCDELVDFTDTAALINEMDLILSVDTSVAHLAGALARPLWILIPYFPDFRWLLDRNDSPWYPTARLFRQEELNDWSSALYQLKIALDEFAGIRSSPTHVLSLKPEILSAQINHAISLHHAGSLTDALNQYLQILEYEPNNTEVLTLLASLYLQQKELEISQKLFNRALSIDSNNILALHNYGLLLEKLGRDDEAIQFLDCAIKLNPLYEDAYRHKANILKKMGQVEAAINLYKTAIEKLPQSSDLYFRLGNELRDVGQTAEALQAMDQAIRYNKNFALAYNNRGNIYLDMKQPLEALKDYQQALIINPNYANAYNNSANAYLFLNQYEDAIAACDAALAIDPNLLTTVNNRANALQKLKRFDEAMQAYDVVIKEHGQYSFAPLNKGLLCLLQGNFSEGWPLYEARLHAAPQPKLLEIFNKPLWLGNESVIGKTLLLHAEQGYGDSIQFCRYALLVLALGAKTVYLNTPKLLYRLVQESFSKISSTEQIKVLTDGDKVPQFDYQCPLMSLPLAFKTNIDSIPASVPYLFANEKLIKKWHARLGTKTKPRVGIVWSGSSAYSNDSNRSISFNLLMPLIAMNIEFHCLQKEIKQDEENVFKTSPICEHRDLLTDFSETAALIEEMDLIISVDTSVAHLAGALGKPVWILLPFVPDFRWLLNRADSPWYPTAKLYRQEKSGDWQTVIFNLIKALRIEFNLTINSNNLSYNNQGNALANQGLFRQAISFYEMEISQNPDNPLAHNNLGVALQHLEKYEEAINCFDQAIHLSQDYVSPRLNKAFLKLKLGDLASGWPLYEWRWKNVQWADAIRKFDQPLWQGAPLKGKAIFIYPEQGLGDFIQLSRYLPKLVGLGAKVFAEVPSTLLSIMSNSMMDIEWVEKEKVPEKLLKFDYYCPIFSLPLAFNTQLESIPSKTPYLYVNPDKKTKWQQIIPLKTKTRIGITWAGAKNHRNDANRSIPINDILGLLQLPYEFHVLQKEIAQQDMVVLNALKQFGPSIYLHRTNLLDFSDTAALIDEMDIVISIDTSVAHMAGALGKPVWILLPHNMTDFRWLLERQDSPWYPTAKLFRQQKSGGWKEVLDQVSKALKQQFKPIMF